MELYLILIIVMISMLGFVFSYLSIIYFGIVREQRRINAIVNLQDQENTAAAVPTASTSQPSNNHVEDHNTTSPPPNSPTGLTTSVPGTDSQNANGLGHATEAETGTTTATATTSTTDFTDKHSSKKGGMVGKWTRAVSGWSRETARRVGLGKKERTIEIGLSESVLGMQEQQQRLGQIQAQADGQGQGQQQSGVTTVENGEGGRAPETLWRGDNAC